MKGIELPVNAIVIVAIAVLVLVVIAAIFLGVNKSIGTMDAQTAWSDTCTFIQRTGCLRADFGFDPNGACDSDPSTTDAREISGYDPNGDGDPDTILVACQAIYGYSGTSSCRDCRNKCCGTTDTTV